MAAAEIRIDARFGILRSGEEANEERCADCDATSHSISSSSVAGVRLMRTATSSAKEFILQFGSESVYTCALALPCGCIEDASFHAKRMMVSGILRETFSNASVAEKVKTVLGAVRAVVGLFRASDGHLPLMITLVADRSAFGVHATRAPSPQLSGNFIAMAIRPSSSRALPSRIEPHIKSGAWINQRKPLEAAKAKCGADEVILTDESGALLEGLITNFFIVTKSGIVQTAGDGVLMGAMRARVLRACSRAGIPVDLRRPTIDDVRDASGAFVTNAIRGVRDVVSFFDVDVACERIAEFRLEKNDVVARIVEAMKIV